MRVARELLQDGLQPYGAAGGTLQLRVAKHSRSVQEAFEAAAALATDTPSQEEHVPADRKYALHTADLLREEMLLRLRLQRQCATASAGLGRCLQTALLSLQEAHSALAAANAHISHLKQQQSHQGPHAGSAGAPLTAATDASGSAAVVQLPQPCAGVYEQRSGQGRFFSATLTAGGYWQCQEKTMFLAALRRELRGVARGLTPQLDADFGWSMPRAAWLWAELDERKQPSGHMLWTGPDPDELPDDCSEYTAAAFWDRGTVLRFPPAWSCAPPQRIPAGQMREGYVVSADLTATPAEVQFLLDAVRGAVDTPPVPPHPASSGGGGSSSAPPRASASSASRRSAPPRSSAALLSSALPVAASASALTRSASIASNTSSDTLPYGALAAPQHRGGAPRRGMSARSGSWGDGRFAVAGSSGLDALAEMASLAGPV